MGRLSEALAAGAAAVARAEGRQVVEAGQGTLALLAPGLSGARLSRAMAVFAAAAPTRAARVVVADHLPPDLDPRTGGRGTAGPGFEHLSPLDDVLAQAGPQAALLHRVRRLRIILARRGVVACLWTGAEAEEIVRAVLAEDTVLVGGVLPPLATGLSANPARTGPMAQVLFRPLAFRD